MSIYKFKKKFDIIRDNIFTFIIRHEFKKCKGLIRRGLSLIGGENITVGENTCIGYNCVISVWKCYSNQESPMICIGDNVSIGDYNHITATKGIIISDGVLTGRFVTISDNNHGNTDFESMHIRPENRQVVTKGEVIIGKNVWIGDKVTILSNVKIGEGSIIGANSVVTKDVPPFSIAVGVPAKVVKTNLIEESK